MTRGERSALLWAHVALSLGGWALHTRIHALAEQPLAIIPYVLGPIDIVVVTLLFLSGRRARVAYLLNGLFVIYGITIMTQFGLARAGELGLLKAATSMAGDCLVLFGDFLIGKALFDGYLAETRVGVRPWQFLAPVWWLVHFVLILTVFALGSMVWR